MIRAAGLTLAAVLCLSAAAPESRLEEYFRLRKEAGEAAAAGDLARSEVLLGRALFLYPTAPGSLIRLARVEVAAGKPHEAVAHLAEYAELGLTWDVKGDKALASLTERADFAPVAAQLAANAAPLGSPTVLATLKPGQIYEGLAFHRGAWLVSSVTDHSILIVRDGKAAPFLKPDETTAGLFGMAVDAERGWLWVAEAAGPEIPGSAGPARTGLLKVDLKSGAILARYPAPEAVQFGDVLLGPKGEVYASDSVGAGIWRLPSGGEALSLFAKARDIASPQGMALCDGAALVVADYSTGLHRVALADGVVEPIAAGPTAALAGIDGLFGLSRWNARRPEHMGRPFLATQNGVTPERLLSITLDAQCRKARIVRPMAANTPGMADLTLGAASPRWAGFIAGSGWATQGEADIELQPAILAIPLRLD